MESLRNSNPHLSIRRASSLFHVSTHRSLVQGDGSDNITALDMVACLAEPRHPYSETTSVQQKHLFVSRMKLVQYLGSCDLVGFALGNSLLRVQTWHPPA